MKTEPSSISFRDRLSSAKWAHVCDIRLYHNDFLRIETEEARKSLRQLFGELPPDVLLAAAPDNLLGQQPAQGPSEYQFSPPVALKQRAGYSEQEFENAAVHERIAAFNSAGRSDTIVAFSADDRVDGHHSTTTILDQVSPLVTV